MGLLEKRLMFLLCIFAFAQSASAQITYAMCEPGPFVITFDGGSAELSDRAISVLDAVESNYGKGTRCGGPISLTGYSYSGEYPADFALARERALNARTHLIDQGFPAPHISIIIAGPIDPIFGTQQLSRSRVEIQRLPWSSD